MENSFPPLPRRLRQARITNLFKKQADKQRAKKISEGVTRKKSKILSRLSGLSRKRNNSKLRNNMRVSRIKSARNMMLREHRMKTAKPSEFNELANTFGKTRVND
jgi:hypothetical protein